MYIKIGFTGSSPVESTIFDGLSKAVALIDLAMGDPNTAGTNHRTKELRPVGFQLDGDASEGYRSGSNQPT
jgi:hypothetical protein